MSGNGVKVGVRPCAAETEKSGRPGEEDRYQTKGLVCGQDGISAESLGAMGRIRYVLEEGGHDDLVAELLEIFNEMVHLQASSAATAAQNEALKQRVIRLSVD